MGQLNYPAQASPVWGDQSGRSQSIIDAIQNRAWVLGTILNHATRGQMMIGFYPSTTIDDEPNAGIYTASNFLRVRTGANTGGRENDYSASTDYPCIVVWTETGYQFFTKRGGDWYRDWHIRQADAQNYIGFSNYDAIGSLQDRWICQSHKADLFAFDIDIESPQIGDNSAAFGELPEYEWYMEFDYVTQPSAGYIEFDYGFYEDVSVSPTKQAYYAVRIDSASLIEVGLYYDGTFFPSNFYPDTAPTITPGNTIRVFTDFDGIRIFENELLVFTYDYSSNFNVGPDYARGRSWELSSLGTAGLIEFLKIGKRRLVNEFGLGADIVINGDFDTDSDWTKDPEWTIGGGVASVVGDTASVAQMYESGASGLAFGKLYKGSFEIPSATTIGAGFEAVSLMNALIADVGTFVSQMAYAYEVGSFAGRMWSRQASPKIALHNGKDIVADIDNVVVQEVLFVSDALALLFDSMLGL